MKPNNIYLQCDCTTQFRFNLNYDKSNYRKRRIFISNQEKSPQLEESLQHLSLFDTIPYPKT